jgi:hypothetical protein
MKKMPLVIFFSVYVLWVMLLVLNATSVIGFSWWVITLPIWLPLSFFAAVSFLLFILVFVSFGILIFSKKEYF